MKTLTRDGRSLIQLAGGERREATRHALSVLANGGGVNGGSGSDKCGEREGELHGDGS